LVKVELFESLDEVERDAAGALDRERQPVLFDRLSWYRFSTTGSSPSRATATGISTRRSRSRFAGAD
jgi:hypothetical protein